jgi:L-methionine (R)-S-oxide reductase
MIGEAEAVDSDNMFQGNAHLPWPNPEKAGDKAALYQMLNNRLDSLIAGEPDWLANISNASALLFQVLPDISWAGFYLMKEGMLVLGPFQGKPACIRIPVGKGVCGTAALEGRTILVPDVSLFPGHIACDAASASEVVVPISQEGHIVGVLDLDSPSRSRFDETDAAGLETFVLTLLKHISFQHETLDWHCASHSSSANRCIDPSNLVPDQ